MLLEDSVFINCSSASRGGSVYFSSYLEGQFVQQRTCYYKSIAKDYGMAFIHVVKSNNSNKNYAFYVSVFNCGENESTGRETFQITSDDLCISNINSTNNKCNTKSSVYCLTDASSSVCNFSTFRKNSQTGSYSLRFWINYDKSLTYTISYCNVIGNKCGTDKNQVLFSCVYAVSINHCIFLKNIANYMFRQHSLEYLLTVSESYVESNSTTGTGNVTFTDLTENYDLNTFSHFFTENCFIDLKEISNKLYYFSKFAKTTSASLLFPSKKLKK